MPAPGRSREPCGNRALRAALRPPALLVLAQAAIGDAYRQAPTGCFTLSGLVMSAAFLLVLGLPDRMLRGDVPAGQRA